MMRTVSLLLVIVLVSCQSKNLDHYKSIIDQPRLDIYKAEFIAQHVPRLSIREIKVYRYEIDQDINESPDSVIEEKRTLFRWLTCRYNKAGQLIQVQGHYYEPRSVYWFGYNHDGQRRYEAFSYNGYDTIYSLYQYNERGDLRQEMRINNRRSELSRFFTHDIRYEAEKILFTEYDYSSDTLLNFTRLNSISLKGNELIKTTYRILTSDSTYNHFEDTATYRVMHNKPYQVHYKSADKEETYSYVFYRDGKIQYRLSGKDTLAYNQQGDLIFKRDRSYRMVYEYAYDAQGNWIKRTHRESNKVIEVIKRVIEYYQHNSSEDVAELVLPQHIYRKADSLNNAIPAYATKKELALRAIQTDLENGDYGKSITLNVGNNLRDFLPRHWELISSDSGRTPPYDSTVIIAAYNTPVRADEEDEYRRCLAIFERTDGKLYLREQLMGALHDYRTGATERKEYTVSLTAYPNLLSVFYQYMRGESEYVFEYEPESKDWVLIFESSSGRSYTNSYVQSYDYKKELLHVGDYPMDDESERGVDTLINVKKSIRKVSLRSRHTSRDTLTIKGYGQVSF